MKKLNIPLVLSILIHIVVIAVFVLLSQKAIEQKERSLPIIAEIIEPEKSPQPLPQTRPQPQAPAKPLHRAPLLSDQPPPEKLSAKRSSPPPGEKQKPGGSSSRSLQKEEANKALQQKTPLEQPAMTAPEAKGGFSVTPSPAKPLKEKLFDRDVIGKLAKKKNLEENKDDGITFDTTDVRYSGYMQRLKERIESIWRYPAEAAEKGLIGDLYIRFTIKKNGKLGEVELVRTSGYKILDDTALKALKEAEPYWPIPDSWKEEELTVNGHFVYTMYGFGIR